MKLTEADFERAALGTLAAQRDALLPRLVGGEVAVVGTDIVDRIPAR